MNVFITYISYFTILSYRTGQCKPNLRGPFNDMETIYVNDKKQAVFPEKQSGWNRGCSHFVRRSLSRFYKGQSSKQDWSADSEEHKSRSPAALLVQVQRRNQCQLTYLLYQWEVWYKRKSDGRMSLVNDVMKLSRPVGHQTPISSQWSLPRPLH